MTGRAGISNIFNFQMPVIFDVIYSTVVIQAIVISVSFFVGTYLGYVLLLKIPGIEKTTGPSRST